ncbi:MAG: HD domain-containing protein [Candidatus Pacearchaeota archaeon]|jgi:HD superfamily phosphodiesterase
MEEEPLLEERLNDVFIDSKLSQQKIDYARKHLDRLKDHHFPTYEHSVRVGLYGYKYGLKDSYEPGLLLLAGLTHDTGKSKLSKEVLNRAPGEFDEKCKIEMRKHPRYSHMLLEREKELAEISLRHHIYQHENSYPEVQPSTDKILKYAMAVESIDFHDANKTRVPNGKYPGNGSITDEERMNLAIKLMPKIEEVIKEFYKLVIFS